MDLDRYNYEYATYLQSIGPFPFFSRKTYLIIFQKRTKYICKESTREWRNVKQEQPWRGILPSNLTIHPLAKDRPDHPSLYGWAYSHGQVSRASLRVFTTYSGDWELHWLCSWMRSGPGHCGLHGLFVVGASPCLGEGPSMISLFPYYPWGRVSVESFLHRPSRSLFCMW